jgi:hypothetical protein
MKRVKFRLCCLLINNPSEIAGFLQAVIQSSSFFIREIEAASQRYSLTDLCATFKSPQISPIRISVSSVKGIFHGLFYLVTILAFFQASSVGLSLPG